MEVECKREKMNEGDAFVLDLGLTIYVWRGAECNKYESAKAVEVSGAIKNERGAKPKVILFKDAEEEEKKAFWEALGGEGPVPSADEGGADELSEKVATENVKLYIYKDDKPEELPVKAPFQRYMNANL